MRSLLCLLALLFAQTLLAQVLLVQDSQPRAQIVIAPESPRMTRLAASELQLYLQKITGARLPITAEPTPGLPRIYVGTSSFTEELGLSTDGLAHGAFHLRTGDTWLALVGHDADYEPIEPWARNRGPSAKHLQEEWDRLTGATWGNPVGHKLFLHRKQLADDMMAGDDTMCWEYDKRGSLYAVYDYLRRLGVRWYMPGELGEIVPEQPTLALQPLDDTVRPAFAVRHMMPIGRFASSADVMWYLRLGLNYGEDVIGVRLGGVSHGLNYVHGRDEMKAAHPEYYRLSGGERDTTFRNTGRPCLSAEGLIQETANYARALFDHYDMPMVSIMPQDGYSYACQCELCQGKETPDRGRDGIISDYVWSFVDKVGRELMTTHPDRKISCFSYGAYTLPPTTIDKLPPNVVVGLVHGRGRHRTMEELRQLHAGWRQKTDNPFLQWEHYVFTHGGSYDGPTYFLRHIAEGLRLLDGQSYGEFVELPFGPKGHELHAPIFNHLNIYVTARLYWDPHQDLDALLGEYFRLFYGPAAAEMKALVEYGEAHWQELRTSPAPDKRADIVARIDHLFGLLDAAIAKAPADSPYAQRLAQMEEYLEPLHHRRRQLTTERVNIPTARLWPSWMVRRHLGAEDTTITLDGKLDEAAWQAISPYHLRESQTGEEPVAPTTFRLMWEGAQGGDLYIGIRCDEPDMESLRTFAKSVKDDQFWHDDAVEVLLETQPHSYYQLAINPNGILIDLDRSGGGRNFNWSSEAEVATHRDETGWSVEIRLPVTGLDAAEDPNHEVVGRKPTKEDPWYFNICRNRPRPTGGEQSAYSPTGKVHFHFVNKFARMRTD